MNRRTPWCGVVVVLLAACVNPAPDADGSLMAKGENGTVNVFVAAGAQDGDGTGGNPFGDIQSGVDAVEAAGGGIVHVRPGTYELAVPIAVRGSHVWLRGAGETLCVDDPGDDTEQAVPCAGAPDLHPSGEMAPGTETVLVGTAPPPGYSNLFGGAFEVGCRDDQHGGCPDDGSDGPPAILTDVEIRGFTIVPNTLGSGVSVSRVQGFHIEGNAIQGGFMGVTSVASSGSIARNHATGGTGGAIVFAGYTADEGQGEASPATVHVTGNTYEGTGTEGTMLVGSSTSLPEEGSLLVAGVHDNYIASKHWGIRVIPELRPHPSDDAFEGCLQNRCGHFSGADQVYGKVVADIGGNTLRDNTFTYQLDGGFSYRLDLAEGASGAFTWDATSQCAPRWYTGRLEVSIAGDTLEDNTWNADLSFGRPQDELWGNWQYLHYAEFVIEDADHHLIDANGNVHPLVQIDHPAYDAIIDLTPDDPSHIDACADQREYDYEGGPRLHPDTPLETVPGVDLELPLGNVLQINGFAIGNRRISERGVSCTEPSLDECFATCDDGADNDGDGAIDADEPECADTCSDQADNDDDGDIDGADPACSVPCGVALNGAVQCSNPFFPPPAPPFPVSLFIDAVSYCIVYTTPLAICDATFAAPLDWLQGGARLSGGDGTAAYYAVIDCAQSSACNGDLDCIIATCGPEITACQQTPCLEGP